PRAEPGEQAVGAVEQPLDLGRRRQAGEDHLGRLGSLARGGGHPGARGLAEPPRHLGGPVPGRERVEPCHPGGHRPADGAEAEEGDAGTGVERRLPHSPVRRPSSLSYMKSPARLSPIIVSVSTISRPVFSSSTCSTMNHWSSAWLA